MYIPNAECPLQKIYIKQRQPILYNWFVELEAALNLGSTFQHNHTNQWQLLGQGFLVECDDKDAYIHFLRWVAEVLQIELIELSLAKDIDFKNIVNNLTDPTIIYLESGRWLNDEDGDDQIELRQDILSFFQLAGNRKILLTSICESYGNICEEFRYRGRFDRHITWTPPRPETYADDFISMLGIDLLNEDVLNNKKRLGSLLCAEFESLRRLEMLCIASQRKSAFLGSKLSWKDILEIAIRGTGDGIYGHPNNNPIQIASHEAGHAVLTIIESNGKNIPDYVSILPGKDMLGVMAEDYEQSYASLGYMSFAMIRSKIRIMLAGRAGEEVLLGETGVGISTANEDLREATWQAFALMARGGFHAHYGKNYSPQERLGLLVTIRNKVPENSDYFQEQARLFLSEQYAEVKQMLLKNRELLSVLQHELVANKILLQDDVTRILASTNQPHFPLAA